jgi:Na+/H+ antiporter NhaD/arsenite permease-like protein
VSLLLVIPLSAFINNTPVVVVMIPLVLGLTRKMQIAPSRCSCRSPSRARWAAR